MAPPVASSSDFATSKAAPSIPPPPYTHRHIPLRQVERLEQTFKGVDADSSGSISAKEMSAHIAKV
jgi:Ca2+-binding EF-hand superfamily protein